MRNIIGNTDEEKSAGKRGDRTMKIRYNPKEDAYPVLTDSHDRFIGWLANNPAGSTDIRAKIQGQWVETRLKFSLFAQSYNGKFALEHYEYVPIDGLTVMPADKEGKNE